MRSQMLIKAVFVAAVLCTVLNAALVIAAFVLYGISQNMLTAVTIAGLGSFLLWGFHHSLTHDSMGRKIKPSAEPVYKKTGVEQHIPPSPYTPPSTGRFVFDEDFFLKKMRNIANRFNLKLSYETSQSWDNDDVLWYEAALTGKYNFELSFRDDMISITPVGLNVHNYYTFSYSFEFFDDAFSECKANKYERKAHKNYADRDFEYTAFASDIMFGNLSDYEIFDIAEKIIEALYGARSMKYETIEADDGRESFIFYLDAPDYYGFSETMEIGNFKFILNKENGGN